MARDRLAYWLKGEKLQNFGDYLGEFLAETLFVVFDEASELRLSGSVIDDGLIPPNLAQQDQFDRSQRRVSFWGCGIRTRGGFLLANKAYVDIFAVRGPISASDLRLGQTIPTGDPALLLPALYTPKSCPQFEGRAVCIPHINDLRSDEELLALGKGDAILRTEILDNQAAFLRFIDSVTSASFVLSASLHGAIVAAAYGRPFAFWSNGQLDIPTKWEDFALYANLEMHGSETVTHAKGYYRRKIKPKLKLPSIWPLLANAPCQVKPAALLQVLRYELMREGEVDASRALNSKIETFQANPNHFDLLAERTRTYSGMRLKVISEKLEEKTSQLTAVQAAAERREDQARIQGEEVQLRIGVYCERVAELSRVIEASDSRVRDSDLRSLELQRRLDEAGQVLNAEQRNFATKASEFESRVTELSSQVGLAQEARMTAEADVAALKAEFSCITDASDERVRDSEVRLLELQRRLDEASHTLDAEHRNIATKAFEFDSRVKELSHQIGLAQEARMTAEANIAAVMAERSSITDASDERVRNSELKLLELQRRLDEANQTLNVEQRNFTTKGSEFDARVKELSNQVRLAHGAHMVAKANTTELKAELARNSVALAAAQHLVGRHSCNRLRHDERLVDLSDRISALDRELELDQGRHQAAVKAAELAHAKTAEANSLREKALAEGERSQAAAVKLTGELSAYRSQTDKIRASLRRSEYDLLLERLAKKALDARILRLEREVVARTQIATGRQRMFDRFTGRSATARRTLARQVERIADYADLFEASRIFAPDPAERGVRIVQFLLSASDKLPDLPFFDIPTYVRMYREIIPSGVNPLIHYLSCPPEAKQRPHLLFDTEYYQDHYPDSVATNFDSLAHYVRWGADKSYNPHPIFDTRYYLARYPDVAAGRVNPLAHYLQFPGCCPHPLFDTEYYLHQCQLEICPGQTPLEHYLTEGAVAGLDPHPLFASRFYLDRYTDVAAAGVNPLVHYLTHGAREGRDPHPAFSTQAYIDTHPNLVQSGENPLVHFVVTERERLGANMGIAKLSAPVEAGRSEISIAVVASPMRRTVLMVDASYPRPDKDSGSLDQVAFVRIFQALGYRVHYAADLELGVETPYREQLVAMGVECVTYPKYLSIDDYLARNTEEIAIAFLSRVHFGSRHIEAIRQLCPESLVIFNTVDLHHVREQREAELNGNSQALTRAKETYHVEAAATRDADATIVVSQREAAYWQAEVPEGKVFMVPLVRDYKVGRLIDYEGRSGIAFIGGFKHMPNVDAVTYFLDAIWPLVRAEMPEVEFQVIGADLPENLSSRVDPGVRMVGYVEDLEAHLAGLRMTVAPLRYGAGAKGKVVSSLAYGVPCVVSPIASEGMGLTDGLDVAVADTPTVFAEKIINLYRDRNAWVEQSDHGMNLIRERHSLDHGTDLMRNIIRSVGRSIAA
jgi:hypothetical protein